MAPPYPLSWHPRVMLARCALLLGAFALRVFGLGTLPLHVDEVLHLRRAMEVHNGHPFWDLTDGKLINHWPIAMLLPGAASPAAQVLAVRLPTVLVALLGLAACMALAARLLKDHRASLWAGLFVIGAPYLAFYDRIGQSDAQAGAFVALAALLGWHAAQRDRWRTAVWAGGGLSLAVLFKFTAAPYALLLAVLLLPGPSRTWPRRMVRLVLAGAVVVGALSVPVAYLLVRGRPLFDVALGWLGGGGITRWPLVANITTLAQATLGYGPLGELWSALLVAGLLLVGIFGGRAARWMLAAWALPSATLLLLGVAEVRHLVVLLPVGVSLAGGGWWALMVRWPAPTRVAAQAVLAGVLLLHIVPFSVALSTFPPRVSIPMADRLQFISGHSAGYGLVEAVEALPGLLPSPDVPVVASMFPYSCARANVYAPGALVCADAPGTDAINAALREHGVVFVLTERLVGLSVEDLAAQGAQHVATFARPGDPEDAPSLTLWQQNAPRRE